MSEGDVVEHEIKVLFLTFLNSKCDLMLVCRSWSSPQRSDKMSCNKLQLIIISDRFGFPWDSSTK